MEGEELVGSDLHIILDDTSVYLTPPIIYAIGYWAPFQGSGSNKH